MKHIISEFFRRGLAAFGFGPIVLAVLYLVLQENAVIHTLTVREVCLGIFSLSALAFIAGGMNVIYQIEQLPLMVAIFVHGLVLYISYLVTYLINRWLEWGAMSVLVFSGIFIFGYFVIWVIIYAIIKRNTRKINEILEKKKQSV